MYQPYPSGSQLPGQPARPVAPPPVQMAVKLMYVGAGLSAIGLVWTLVTNTPVLSNGQWIVSLPKGANGSGFYQLQ